MILATKIYVACGFSPRCQHWVMAYRRDQLPPFPEQLLLGLADLRGEGLIHPPVIDDRIVGTILEAPIETSKGPSTA